MAGCFTKDAVIDMSWFNGPAAEFVQRSRVMDVGGARGVHRLSPPAVHVTGDRAIAELPLVAAATIRATDTTNQSSPPRVAMTPV